MSNQAPDQLPNHTLDAWLTTRRWSGARGGVLHVLGIQAVPLFDAPPASLRVLRVTAAGSAPYELLLPVVRRPLDDPALPPSTEWLPGSGDTGVTFDATHDPEFRRALLDAVRGDAAFADPRVSAARIGGVAVPNTGTSRVGTAEQSNTSIVYDGGVILKLFRRVEVGVNPDVEIGRFLARCGFAHVPRLYGTVALGRDDGEAVIAMAQALVPDAEDAWAFAVRAAGAAVEESVAPKAYADEAARLGRVTRALHDALASDAHDPDFAPEPAGAAHVRRWAANAHRAVDEAAVAARTSSAPGAELVRERQGDVAALVDAAVAAVGDAAGAAVRHHGDYHLGQLLRAGSGELFVIDFEGEPARPLAERRLKHSPLRDVAGMLRSFAYAAAFALRDAGSGVGPAAAARADAWERHAREAFLEAYLAGSAAPYLPPSRAGAAALLALFELEKLVYEVRYELRNRPDWAAIPLGALGRRLGPQPAGA